MKSRSWILILVVVLIALFWILWPRPIQPVHVAEQGPEVPSTNKQVTNPQIPQSAQPGNPSLGEILNRRNPEKLKEAKEREAKSIEALNRTIDFYGQTVDQDGNPLPEVRIKMTVPHYVAFSLDGKMLHVERISDAYGLFDIHDASITGDGIDLDEMSKEGYTLEPMRRGLGPVGGAPGNPVIFKLWRNDIKEPLITGQKSFEIVPDGRMYFIDITNGIMTERSNGTADIGVWVKRPPDIAFVRRFDWSGGLQVLNGGALREENLDAAMYVAPTDGYSNLVQFGEAANLNGWGGGFGSRRFYLSLNSGHQVGRITISLYAYYNRKTPGLIRIEYAINPTGSRILR